MMPQIGAVGDDPPVAVDVATIRANRFVRVPLPIAVESSADSDTFVRGAMSVHTDSSLDSSSSNTIVMDVGAPSFVPNEQTELTGPTVLVMSTDRPFFVTDPEHERPGRKLTWSKLKVSRS